MNQASRLTEYIIDGVEAVALSGRRPLALALRASSNSSGMPLSGAASVSIPFTFISFVKRASAVTLAYCDKRVLAGVSISSARRYVIVTLAHRERARHQRFLEAATLRQSAGFHPGGRAPTSRVRPVPRPDMSEPFDPHRPYYGILECCPCRATALKAWIIGWDGLRRVGSARSA